MIDIFNNWPKKSLGGPCECYLIRSKRQPRTLMAQCGSFQMQTWLVLLLFLNRFSPQLATLLFYSSKYQLKMPFKFQGINSSSCTSCISPIQLWYLNVTCETLNVRVQKPEDLWAKHSLPVHPKPHSRNSSSWRAILEVKSSMSNLHDIYLQLSFINCLQWLVNYSSNVLRLLAHFMNIVKFVINADETQRTKLGFEGFSSH